MTATPAQRRLRRIAAGEAAGTPTVPAEHSQRGSATTVPSTTSATAALDQHARRASKWGRRLILFAVVLVLLGALIHTARVLINHRAEPDAAIVLEGDPARIRYAAQFAKAHPQLPIYISSEPVFYKVYLDALADQGVPLKRFELRTCATDTLTNFTCIADELRQHGYRRLYLITSEDHMPRALTTGRIVLGRHGMALTPLPVATSRESKESPMRTVRDALRALLWSTTGFTAPKRTRGSG